MQMKPCDNGNETLWHFVNETNVWSAIAS